MDIRLLEYWAQNISLQWPMALWALLLIPLGWLGLAFREKYRMQRAMAFSYTATLLAVKPQGGRFKRLWWPMVFSLAMGCLVVGAARPTLTVKVPNRAIEMMMVLDISLSMMAADISPDRLSATKAAGIRFVESLPKDVRVGLTVFAGNSYLLSPPTRDHRKVAAYLKGLQLSDLQPRTEMGSAIQVALKSLAEPPDMDPQDRKDSSGEQHTKPPQKLMLLMSDGDSHEGYPWPQAAMNARKQNVVIHTVGIGTGEPVTIRYHNQVLPVLFSEETLKAVAQKTGGQYFRVFRSSDFAKVYHWVSDRSMDFEEKDEELAAACIAVALGLLLLGLTGSAFWVRRTGPG